MSESHIGALIIVARRNELQQFADTGEKINGRISAALIITIFYKNNPLHDGAMIIVHNKIASARCILPLSTKTNIPAEFGLRHRAAIGITEQSDAIAIVVSEQTGEISYSHMGELTAKCQPEELQNMLAEVFDQA